MAEEIGDCDKSYAAIISKVVEEALVEIMAIRREIRQVTVEDEEYSKSIIFKSIVGVVTSHMSNVKSEMLKVLFESKLMIVVT